MKFNDWLRDRRDAAGLTNKAIAQACDVSEGAVGRWIRGERVPERAQVVALSLLFKVSPVTILRMTDHRELQEEIDIVGGQQSMAELLAHVPELAEFMHLLWKMPVEKRAALILLARDAAKNGGSSK